MFNCYVRLLEMSWLPSIAAGAVIVVTIDGFALDLGLLKPWG